MDLKRVLLVEDDPNDIELTLIALAGNHLADEVDVVRDGEESLDYLYRRGVFRLRHEEHPVVILLDLKLPKINGLEVLAQIKASPQLRMIPVVILTSSREEQDIVSSYNLGTNAYVVKPVVFHEFVDAIRGLGLFWAAVNQPPPLLPDRSPSAC